MTPFAGRAWSWRRAGRPDIDEGLPSAFVGSGNYASGVLIPAFKAAGARLVTVASSGGAASLHAGRKFGFEEATTDAVASSPMPLVGGRRDDAP